MSAFVTFRTSAAGHVTMFRDAAVTLLKAMGQSGELPGAILGDDVPAALARLKAGVDALARAEAGTAQAEVEDERDRPVSPRARAWPLIDLFTRAAKQRADVIWEAGQGY